MRRRSLLIIFGALGLIGLGTGWYFFRPDRAFTNRTVDESFPVAASGQNMTAQPARSAPALAPTVTLTTMAEGEAMMDEDEAMMGEELPMATPTAPAPTAPAEPVALTSGTFHGVAHEGEGTATIYQLPGGKRVLRLTDFSVLDGPDLYVYLIAASDADDSATVADGEYVSLGEIKGNQGNQNYEIPDDVDLSKYHAVSIWCKRFAVNFATAPLGML